MSEMTTPNNRLVPLPRSDWPALRNLYRRDWPKHLLGYQLVDGFIRWIALEPGIVDLEIFSLNGDWMGDGTFMAANHDLYFINTVSDSTKRLETAFRLIEHHDHESIVVLNIEDQHRAAIDAVLMASKRIAPSIFHSTPQLYLAREKAAVLEIESPVSITLAPLREEHATIVDTLWALGGTSTSLNSIKRTIRLNPSVGAFDANGNLLAWCLRNVGGQLFVLQVAEGHAGRGLGSLVCRAISRKVAEMGDDVWAHVFSGNERAMRLFRRIGFEIVDTNHFVEIVKNKE